MWPPHATGGPSSELRFSTQLRRQVVDNDKHARTAVIDRVQAAYDFRE